MGFTACAGDTAGRFPLSGTEGGFLGAPQRAFACLASERSALPPSRLSTCGAELSYLCFLSLYSLIWRRRRVGLPLCLLVGQLWGRPQLLAICSGARGQRLGCGLGGCLSPALSSSAWSLPAQHLASKFNFLQDLRGFLLQMPENKTRRPSEEARRPGSSRAQMPAGGGCLWPCPRGAGPNASGARCGRVQAACVPTEAVAMGCPLGGAAMGCVL